MTRIITLASGLLAIATMAAAEDVAPSAVSFADGGAILASLSGMPGDPANGAVVMVDRTKGNCIACHQVTAINADFPGNVGPSLDGAGDRWDESQLRGIVSNAKMTFPDTVMPSFYKNSGYIRPGAAFTGKAPEGDLPPLLTAQEVEDVVAYLATLK